MAEKIITIIERTDDLDGREATEKRKFGWAGKDYEIDLCNENAADLDARMAVLVKAARRIRAGEENRAAVLRGTLPTIPPVPERDVEWWHDPAPPLSKETRRLFTAARLHVRRFGREHGWELGQRGVVPNDVYLKWFDEVWCAMPEPSWEALARQEAEAKTALPAARKPPRRTTKTTRKS